MFGKKPFKGPFAIGHESVAEVMSCGDDVNILRPEINSLSPMRFHAAFVLIVYVASLQNVLMPESLYFNVSTLATL